MKKLASGMVILAGILWGSMGIFVRKFEKCGLESLDIVAVRAIATTCILFFFLLFYNRSLLKIKFKDLWCFLGTGLLSIVFFNYCYFRAITMTSLSVAAVLLYTAPAFVMVHIFYFTKNLQEENQLHWYLLLSVVCLLLELLEVHRHLVEKEF